ncbi:50S ribosomal protein L28, apicoplast, putative, partial [Hepatocystis sp. ex Piliocolobus tephrosceles]
MRSQYKNKIYSIAKNVYIFYIVINLSSFLCLGLSSVIHKNELNGINLQNYFF